MAQAASLAYFFPLNYARNRSVALEAERLGFFNDVTRYYDFGSGTGSALFAFMESLSESQDLQAFAQDIDPDSLKIARKLKPQSIRNYATIERHDLPKSGEGTLLSASYVLTELPDFPVEWLKFDSLAIIEPSTRLDGRSLMSHRQTLIDNGYKIWAPCTHQDFCPLLVDSDRDWCHDRIHWRAPEWLDKIEKFLPMKNRTLTFSYLLAKREKDAPSPIASLARLTGDMLIEKGKTRQSVCRGPEKEFLSWFPQRMKDSSIDLQRGNLVRLTGELEKRGTEVRLKTAESILEIPPLHNFTE